MTQFLVDEEVHMAFTNILVVDDSSVDRKIIGKVIKDAGIEVTIIENVDGKGIEALLRRQDIKLIVLDIMLPNRNGLDILEAVKKNPYTTNIPVIVCSGLDEDEVIKKSLFLGAYDFFEKPLSDRAIKFSLALKVRNAIELIKHAEEVDYLSNHDQLTSLKTRGYFESNLTKYDRAEHYPLTFLMLDIDGLKIFNDAYGREVGDVLIQLIGEFLHKTHDNLLMCARWGSDEFILLLSNYEPRRCEGLVQDLREYLAASGEFHGINISYGLEIVEEVSFDEGVAIQRAEENLYSNKILESRSIRSNILGSIQKTLHEKNPREESHSRRVSEISGLIAVELGFSEYEVKKVKMAGLMHDIGKISIDESIINKPGKLHTEEWEAIKKHPEMGYRILSASTDTIDIAKAVLTHHERFDGKGYPQGLAGKEIPLLGRIICVADSFDAMTGPRTYKEVFSLEKAVNEIEGNGGTQYDPVIVKAFMCAIDKKLISL